MSPRGAGAEGKLGTRGIMCIHLGIDEEAKAWRMFDPRAQRVRITRNVDFLEHMSRKQLAGDGRTGEGVQDAGAGAAEKQKRRRRSRR